MKLISKFALLILVIAILFLLFTRNMLSQSPFVIVGQLAAIGLSIWARRNFQREQFSIHAEPGDGPLLSTGPYQFIRHPMYTSALLLIWSSILGHLSMITFVIGLIVTAVIAVRISTEEQFLRARFPDYIDYAAKTKQLIPFII